MRIPILILTLSIIALGSPASAGIFGRGAKPAPQQVSEALISDVTQAIDEQRLLDAGRMLDQALLNGATDPRLTLLGGDLNLARGRHSAALAAYRSVEGFAPTKARAFQGQGIVLSLTGRSDEALSYLQKAVAEEPSAWRAWNVLGSEFDRCGDWAQAETAYQHAMDASGGAAIVLNNRGYSRLLQHRPQEAAADFVAAIQKRPDFPQARTNLRLALAFSGEYERSVTGGAPDDQAAMLNNAGFAAGARGDYDAAKTLLDRAVAMKGEYYGRAAENLKIVRALAAQNSGPDLARP